MLGEKERAIEFLEKAYEQREGYLPSMASDFVYENLHGEPRYDALVKKMGLNSPKKSEEQEKTINV